jgi:hypothetical protein
MLVKPRKLLLSKNYGLTRRPRLGERVASYKLGSLVACLNDSYRLFGTRIHEYRKQQVPQAVNSI